MKMPSLLNGFRHLRTCSAADGRDDRDLGAVLQGRLQAAGIAGVFVADEDVDVLADLSLLGNDAVADRRILFPQRLQGRGESGGGMFEDDPAFASGEGSQGAGYQKSHRHLALLPPDLALATR